MTFVAIVTGNLPSDEFTDKLISVIHSPVNIPHLHTIVLGPAEDTLSVSVEKARSRTWNTSIFPVTKVSGPQPIKGGEDTSHC